MHQGIYFRHFLCPLHDGSEPTTMWLARSDHDLFFRQIQSAPKLAPVSLGEGMAMCFERQDVISSGVSNIKESFDFMYKSNLAEYLTSIGYHIALKEQDYLIVTEGEFKRLMNARFIVRSQNFEVVIESWFNCVKWSLVNLYCHPISNTGKGASEEIKSLIQFLARCRLHFSYLSWCLDRAYHLSSEPKAKKDDAISWAVKHWREEMRNRLVDLATNAVMGLDVIRLASVGPIEKIDLEGKCLNIVTLSYEDLLATLIK